MLTLNQITPSIMQQIEEYYYQIGLIDAVCEVLKTFDGKAINKRIETAVKKRLPDYSVFYESKYSFYSITIWGNEIPYDKRLQLLLAYNDKETFSYENFQKHNVAYLVSNRKAKAELESYIDNEEKQNELQKLIDLKNEIEKKIEELKTKTPDIYPIRKFLKI